MIVSPRFIVVYTAVQNLPRSCAHSI